MKKVIIVVAALSCTLAAVAADDVKDPHARDRPQLERGEVPHGDEDRLGPVLQEAVASPHSEPITPLSISLF
jgi:hypothetical protein